MTKEKVEKENKKKEKKEKTKKEFNFKKLLTKKNIIIITISLLIIIIATVVTINVIIPTIQYNNATEALKDGKYEKAIDAFDKLNSYKNSRKKLREAYYKNGIKLLKEGKYQEAKASFEEGKGNRIDDYISLCEALNKITSDDIDKINSGISTIETLGKFADADKELNKAYYMKAENYFKKKKYDDAITYYEKAGEHKDSKNKIDICNLMTAEEYYKEGHLKKAQDLYKKLPSSLIYEDINVTKRLNTLKEYSQFVNLTGTWKGTNGKMHVRETWKYNGSWDGWDGTYTSSLTTKCVINDNGTVKISITATFWTYTNYSSVGYLLKSDSTDAYFTKTVNKDDKIPSSFGKFPTMVAPSGETGSATLTYSNNKYSLSFKLYDKDYSQSFSRTYKSSITYNKRS